MIGPFRGGRTVGAVGVRQQPNVFYIGVNNGGVWKTEDFGRTWFPIFDDQPTGSIGDIVVAPSDPNILYVGSGEGLQRPDLSVGDGVYKSTDAGKTWKHTGLRDGQQIGGLAIDPENPDRVFAAVLGHPYGANTERGVFRTINGGSSWEKVLFIDENTGAIQVTLDPKDTKTVYATLWAARQGPWENGSWQGPASGLYKSTDGGTTWKKLTQGLPTTKEGLGRIGFCIAPSLSSRLYATVDSPEKGGLYRSDDGGNSWRLMNPDNRLWGRGGDFAEVKVDPRNPDIVYSANVAFWKSTDGGKNWTCVRGAPGGDDYHRIWINPDNPDIMLLAADQGAIITVNGGKTYSSWYNQPTAQFYHVSTDNAFPYNVLGGQQESGSASVSSRGHGGQITYRDWLPVGVEEWGYVAADPLNPDLVYGGKLTKYDRKTGHTQSVGPFPTGHYQPNRSPYRFLRTAPVIFSQADPTALYYAGNVLFKSQDGGHAWRIISPDLSRESWDVPKSIGVYTTESMKTMARRGVIYTVAPSPLDSSVIWAGTDDGLIHITRDGGKTWQNVTPAEITSWSKISLIDAGHFDVNTAYVAVNRIRLDDMKPYIYKTHDGGKTWIKIVEGLPDDPINAVREDHIKEGLLICGSERAVYAS
ncbi:MAG TPA: glycoside hydrolase, partial [bacterium]|nr:glycoside hydrolase [bacterium]HNO10045.1 glycoside hydrolase [bacterium]